MSASQQITYPSDSMSLSVAGIVAMARAIPSDKLLDESKNCRPGNYKWVPRTREDVMERALRGAPDMVARAEKLAAQFAQPVGQALPEWTGAVAGQRPCVPAFVAGQPESMMRLQRTAPGPVRIFVSLSVCASVTAKEAESRGAAILAAVLQLQAMGRSVEVCPVFTTSLTGWKGLALTRVLMPGPVSVAHLASIISSADFMRGVMLEVQLQRFPNIGRSFPLPENSTDRKLNSGKGLLDNVDSNPFAAAMVRLLALTPDDVYVPALLDGAMDGEKWLRNVIAAHSEGVEA